MKPAPDQKFKQAPADLLAALDAAREARKLATRALYAAKDDSPALQAAADEADAVYGKALEKMPSVGKIALANAYDRHAVAVLSSTDKPLLEGISEGRGKRYVFTGKPPTPEEYVALRVKKFTTDAESLIADAQSVVEDLGNQLREWYDNLPEGLQQGDKGSTLEQSAGELEDAAGNSPDVPERLTALPVYFAPSEDTGSRSKQRDEACAMLAAVAEACNDARTDLDGATTAEDLPAWLEIPEGVDVKTLAAEMIEELDELAGNCEEMAGNCENVEFPGMYG